MATVDPRSSGDRMWERESRFGRRAEVVFVDRLTETGTVRIGARVTDDQPFDFKPGQFLAFQEDVPGVGVQRSPYCMFQPPAPDRSIEMLIRVFPEGPLSHYIASMRPGMPLAFRGPSGRSMLPKDDDVDSELVMLATGVGISPLHSVIVHLLRDGRPPAHPAVLGPAPGGGHLPHRLPRRPGCRPPQLHLRHLPVAAVRGVGRPARAADRDGAAAAGVAGGQAVLPVGQRGHVRGDGAGPLGHGRRPLAHPPGALLQRQLPGRAGDDRRHRRPFRRPRPLRAAERAAGSPPLRHRARRPRPQDGAR